MKEIEIYYVYYSYEQFGRGYIGYRKCPEGLTPETDNYLGSFRDKGFKPTEKIILFQDLTKLEAMEIEIKLHAFYNVKDNPNFANKSNAIAIGFNFSASGENNPNYGKTGEKHPHHGKKCYNNGIENKYFSPEEEIPEGYFLGGLQTSEETKLKISKAKKGKKRSKETRQKMSKAQKGKTYSEETKRKWSIKVISSLCCYYSMKDAYEELGISITKFYKRFEKDPNTGFYMEK